MFTKQKFNMTSQFNFLSQTNWITAGTIAILLVTSRCQNIAAQSEEQSEDWKQAKIATLYKNYAQEFPQVTGIEAEKLKRLLQQGEEIVLVDVRSPDEMTVSMLPGAITKEEFERNIKQYQNKMIVAYCTIGYRSGKYARSKQLQDINILNLEGSLLAWSHVQGNLVNDLGATKQVHIFNRQWQLTADDYQPVW